MHTSDVATAGNAAGGDDREAKLRAAAELMRTWVKTQRAGGAEFSGAARHRFDSPSSVTPLDPRESDPAPVITGDEPAFAPLAEAVAAPPASTEPTAAAEIFKRRTGPLVPPELLTWVGRAAAAAVVAAAVVGISWTVRRSWPAWKPTPNVGTAVLESDPPGATVLIDGEDAGTTPLTKELPAGSHRVEFRQRNVTRLIPIEVMKGKVTSTKVEWNVRRVGSLKVASEPTGARVSLNGKDAGTTPTTIKDLVVGNYTLVLKAEGGTIQRTVSVNEGATTDINESIFSGWLHVSSPIDLEIAVGRKVIQIDDRNQALIPPGTHEVRFVNKALGFSERRRLSVKPGETTSVTIKPPQSSLTVTTTYPAEVLIDGERVGDTPLERVPVNIGTRDVTINSLLGGVRRMTLTVTVEPMRLDIDYSKP